jgi:hypothetical protein
MAKPALIPLLLLSKWKCQALRTSINQPTLECFSATVL